MQLQVLRKTDHGSVSLTMTAEGDRAAESSVTSATSRPKELGDDLASRRQFDALIAPHISALRARARQLCRSHYDSEDVLQDALMRAFLTGSQVRDPARIRPWLLTIITHTFIDLTRKRRRRPDHLELVVEMPAPDPIEAAPWDDFDSDDLRRAIDALPDDVRETYRMFAVEGCDYAAISAAQKILPATVGTRLYRARKRLRQLLTAGSPRGKTSR